MLGLEGVSSHSTRGGLASELVRRGASTTAVQATGGWRCAAMVACYASAVAVEDLDDDLSDLAADQPRVDRAA